MIVAKGAGLAYQDHGRVIHACRDVDLEIKEGEFLGILGPSGSGKSSLLYLLSGMRAPTSGEILLDGKSLHEGGDEARAKTRLDRFGFVFQLPHLIGYLTALENVILACPGREVADEAAGLLAELGLKDNLHRKPHELSGGQKQRVCVARALVGGRSVIFADEPTAALDQQNGLQVVQMLARRRGKGALVMVTHDPNMLTEADRIIQLVDGRVVKES